jgi:BTB/POZ domain-containing protein 10
MFQLITTYARGMHVVCTWAGFRAIIDYYKYGEMRCPPNVSVSELKDACEFFLVPFSHRTVKAESVGLLLHQLSNKGAESQFDMFLESILTPAMALNASLGERECHIVLLRNEDTVDWDDDLPPRLGEQYAQVRGCGVRFAV